MARRPEPAVIDGFAAGRRKAPAFHQCTRLSVSLRRGGLAANHGKLAGKHVIAASDAARSCSVIAFRHRRFVNVLIGLLALDVFTLACSSGSSKPATSSSASTTPADATTALWGPITPVVSVKELMHDLIDPVADNVFESVKIIIDKHGTVETKPRTDEDWDRVRIGATMLVEASQLLLVRRPFAPPGEESSANTHESPTLTSAEIQAKVEKDPVVWQAKIQALRNVGLEVLDIIKKKDTEQLWDAGENLDEACENCHIQYWYPGDVALYERLDRRLEELYGPRANRKSLGMPKK